jgi:hypothetical protein
MIRRILRGAGVVALLAGALLLAGAPAALAASGESIPTYDTRVEVQASGQMRITETIGYDFGANRRHGIIRKIPARFRYDDQHDRVYPIDGLTVAVDGAPAKVARSSEGGYEVLKIGDPDRTISGAHTYVIGYTVRGGLNGFPDHEELYWNVVGDEWEVPIATATATVTGPAAIERTACYAGPNGSRLSCASASAAEPRLPCRPDRGGRLPEGERAGHRADPGRPARPDFGVPAHPGDRRRRGRARPGRYRRCARRRLAGRAGPALHRPAARAGTRAR